jgi:hypothetical protein
MNEVNNGREQHNCLCCVGMRRVWRCPLDRQTPGPKGNLPPSPFARQHDANYLTFHRIKDFRKLTMADSDAFVDNSLTAETAEVAEFFDFNL